MFADADDYYLPGWDQTIRDCLLGKGTDSKLLVFAVKTSNGLDTFCCPVDEPFSGPDFQVPASKIQRSMIDNSLSGMKDNAGDFEWNSSWARLYKRSVLNNLIKVSNGSAFVPNLRFSEDGLLLSLSEYAWQLLGSVYRQVDLLLGFRYVFNSCNDER